MCCILFVSVVGCQAEPESESKVKYKEGIHYKKVATAHYNNKATMVEVLEFFSYGCPHCFNLEPALKKWKSRKPGYVDFQRVPAFWNPYFQLLAEAYYTAQVLKIEDKMHDRLFNAIHRQRLNLRSKVAVKGLFLEAGVSEADFDKTIKSFAVKQKIKMADNLFKRYKLNHVPMIVVGGTYVTDVSMTGGKENVIKVVDFLVKKVREKRTAAVH